MERIHCARIALTAPIFAARIVASDGILSSLDMKPTKPPTPPEPAPKGKPGRKAIHENAAARCKAWRDRRGRRVEIFLGPDAQTHLDALRFSYPELSNSDIVERILADRHRRKDFSLPDGA